MKVYYKKHYTERGCVDISKDYINSQYDGDILGALKEKVKTMNDGDGVKVEILDYDLSEEETNYKKSAEYIEDVYEQIEKDQEDAISLIYEGLTDLRSSTGEVRF